MTYTRSLKDGSPARQLDCLFSADSFWVLIQVRVGLLELANPNSSNAPWLCYKEILKKNLQPEISNLLFLMRSPLHHWGTVR